MSDLRAKSINAYKWNLTDQVSAQAIGFIINIILIRLLTPNDFGLFAIPIVIIGFIRINQDLGLSAYIVHKSKISTSELSFIYWLLLGVGVLLTVIVLLMSPFLSAWTNESESNSILQLLSITILLGSIGFIQEASFRKNLDFKSLFIVNIFSVIISGVVSIVMAINQFGHLALSVKYLGYIGIQTMLLTLLSKFKPEKTLAGKVHLDEQKQYALPLLGTQLLSYASRNIDSIFIGRYIGTSALGLYDRAYKIMLLPLSQVSSSFSKVLFPTFSIIQNQTDKVTSSFIVVIRQISFITFPGMLLLSVLSEPLVLGVFGDQWAEMIPILQVLSALGAIQAISTLSGSVFQALGKTKEYLKLTTFLQSIQISTLVLSIVTTKDIYLVTITYATVATLLFIPQWVYTAKQMGTSFSHLLFPLLTNLVTALIAAVLVYILSIKNIFSNPLVELITLLLVGIVSYILLQISFKSKALTDFVKLSKELLNND